MTLEEYIKLLQYIQKNNSWNEMYEVIETRNRRAIKYVDASMDTRDGSIWRIEFRSIVGHDDISFRVDTPEDLKAIYRFLDEPCMKKEKE